MDFLDNVKNVVGSAAQTVMKKSGEVVEYSKIKYAIFDINNTIKELSLEIGTAVYDSYEKDTPLDGSVKDKCAKIKELKEQLLGYVEQLESYKSMVRCVSCGKSVKNDCSYCPYCGSKLSVEADAEFYSSSEYYTAPGGFGGSDGPDNGAGE
ncbi:MAG TPA: zinc ribbon domain-containing protein [Candidatus Monoglobus merdigallinarum]|uniref:Zinc ribbon domain-containing protein n=1 Tax=Candidatus Monoglobus merdigallinarum TaxID=2838698 RepID=A0A9D1TM72_9FIRM|nr:zinc ribbon domain-containing protein [Candidatus Monoglobus merdigallinarum]